MTGLQRMIDLANRYITDHGLKCNPNKTKCAIFGKGMLYISFIRIIEYMYSTIAIDYTINECN